MKVRPAALEDLDAYVTIQEEEWGETMAAGRLQLESRLKTFPTGVLVGEHEGQVVAGATFIRLSGYDIHEALSWTDLCDDGWCTNHDPNGPVMFGVDLSVSRHAPRSASAVMLTGGIALAIRQGVEAVYWGSRLPRYHKYADSMTPDEYLHSKNRRGRYLDPEVQLYSRAPLVEVVGAVPEYFKDWESENWGAIMMWRNPVHRLPFVRPFTKQVVSLIYAIDRRRK